jgi:hypothetical protein
MDTTNGQFEISDFKGPEGPEKRKAATTETKG